MLQSTKRDQILAQQAAVEEERKRWKVTVQALQTELDQERNDKEAQKNWQCRFIPPVEVPEDVFATCSSSKPAPTIDPKEDVFSRFSQSLALLPASQAPQVAEAGALPFLVHLLQQKMGDVVTGSVLIALVHLAIYRTKSRSHQLPASSNNGLDIREQIVKAGVCTPLVDILEASQNARVLVEASRLCAALASYVPNKRVLASKNVVRVLVQHLMPHIPPRNREKRGDDDEEDISRSPQLARAGAVGLANLAYTSVNQLTIGYSNASTLLLQLLVDAVSQPLVIEAASTALACLCHQNQPNKARVAAQNGLQVLLYALGAIPDTKHDDDERGVDPIDSK
ncbi:hypothetical protein PPTG_13230 [Phytophthora nicotianae INRA-310]|uniref:Uncharacterized protein n=1 Tax=Phytophthora nicotianae (strain INRA-310) TaxID=761204 RepID=W2PY55_PHYN3|nr:hypothetical protein PPTG_13230 [Phytophthora nicotianae INRA-310]ETN05863.1 hypothetical protein PPTG_13230 [Phytophthora nicotianae INRA-310]